MLCFCLNRSEKTIEEAFETFRQKENEQEELSKKVPSLFNHPVSLRSQPLLRGAASCERVRTFSFPLWVCGNAGTLVTFAALLIGDTARQRIRRELVWGSERMTFKSPRTSNHCLIMFGTSFSSVVF